MKSLHLGTLFRLLPSLFNPQFLEVHVRSVISTARVAGGGTLFLQEVGYRLPVYGPPVSKALGHLARERRLCHAGLAQVCADLGTDVIAGVEDRDGIIGFAVQMYIADVKLVEVFFLRFLRFRRCDALQFAVEEEPVRRKVGFVVDPRGRTRELHETVVGVGIYVDLALKGRGTHFIRTVEISDLFTNLVAVLFVEGGFFGVLVWVGMRTDC